MPTVYGYRRRSVAREDQISLDAQGTAIRSYHRRKWGGGKSGVKLVLIDDEGVSGGTPLFARPAGRALLTKLQRGDHLIVTKIDRAWRSLADGALMLGWLIERGVHLHALDLDIDTSTPVGRVCLHILMAIAQMERERIGERRRDANTERRNRGIPWFARTCAPLGWRIVGESPNRSFAPHPEERRELKKILSLHRRGLGYRRLEARLRELGWVNRYGRPWHRSSLRRALWAAANGFPVISHDCGRWGSASDFTPQWHHRSKTAAGKWWQQGDSSVRGQDVPS